MIPKDPVILLSYMNLQLRDHYPDLTEFCKTTGEVEEQICQSLAAIGYVYDHEQNQFI